MRLNQHSTACRAKTTTYLISKFCSHKLFKFEYRHKAPLRQAPVLGVDETGINISGENNWVHIARTDNLTHADYFSHRSPTPFA